MNVVFHFSTHPKEHKLRRKLNNMVATILIYVRMKSSDTMELTSIWIKGNTAENSSDSIYILYSTSQVSLLTFWIEFNHIITLLTLPRGKCALILSKHESMELLGLVAIQNVPSPMQWHEITLKLKWNSANQTANDTVWNRFEFTVCYRYKFTWI